MSKTKSKSESLRKLRQFCAEKPQGMYSYWWFNGLVNAYPLHFLFYSQFSTILTKRQQDAKDSVQVQFKYRVKRLLEYPVSEIEIDSLEKM